MFDYIKIEGFRSFEKVELEMPRLAVLIGPNGGGKSNFIDLLMLMSEAAQGHLATGVNKRGGFPNIAFGFDPSREVRIQLRLREALHRWKLELPVEAGDKNVNVRLKGGEKKLDVRFKIALRNHGFGAQVTEELVRQELGTEPSASADIVNRGPQGVVFRVQSEAGTLTDQRVAVSFAELAIYQIRDPSKYPAASVVLKDLERWTFYEDIAVGRESPVRQPALIRPEIQLMPDGSNLSSVLYSIQQDWPDGWDEISEFLKTACPDFLKLRVPAGGGDGKVLLRWSEKPFERQGGLSANLLSDGTLKLLCLVAILKNPTPPPLICIDEPELGLHPDWIKLGAELLQDAASRTQVIVATHSPQIVAELDPEQVIVAEKVDGETHLTRLKKPELEKWLKDFNLSELWLAGHFGGRP